MITAVSVIFLTIILLILLLYIIKLVKKFRELTELFIRESELISEDIDEIRENVKKGSVIIRNFAIAKFIKNLLKRKK